MPVVTSGHSHHHHRLPPHHSHQQIDQLEQPMEVANDPAIPPNMSSSISSGAITSSSFMPTSAMSSSVAATLPRNLENGYAGRFILWWNRQLDNCTLKRHSCNHHQSSVNHFDHSVLSDVYYIFPKIYLYLLPCNIFHTHCTILYYIVKNIAKPSCL